MTAVSNEGLLTQLGYPVNDSMEEKLDRVIENTRDFDHIGARHIISLNDSLKTHLSYVGLSNSHDYFKIKNEAQNQEIRNEVEKIIEKWSKKYKVELEKVEGKNTYYIIGYKH